MSGEHFASMKTDDWGTPQEIVDLVHYVFQGPPDLDPCSSERHNKRVNAKRFLGIEDRDPSVGIPTDWGDARKIFINPPGGNRPDRLSKKGNKWLGPSYVSLFWEQTRMFSEQEIIWVCYNIGQLQTLQNKSNTLLSHTSLLVPSKRLQYINKEEKPQNGTPSASAILLLSVDMFSHMRLSAWNSENEFGTVWLGPHA